MNEAKGELPPEAFIAQVKQIPENLYKLPYLQTHPLVQADLRQQIVCLTLHGVCPVEGNIERKNDNTH